MDKQSLFKEAIKYNNVPYIKSFLKKLDIDPSHENNWAVMYLSQNGNYNILKLILNDKRTKLSERNIYWAIRHASKNGNINTLKLLINYEKINFFKYINIAIQYAAEYGHFEAIEILLNHTKANISEVNPTLVRLSYSAKYYNIVDLLWHNKIIKKLTKSQDREMYDLLISKEVQKKLNVF
jgi:hypothetical protein